MSNDVMTSIDIAAPPEKVWALVMDPNRLQDWVTIHRKLDAATADSMEQTLCLRGVTFHVKWELATRDEPTHAIWKGRGPARSKAETEYRLTPDGNGGTHFDYRNEFKPPLGPLGSVASRALVGGLPEREANASLAKLKALLES